MDNQHQHIKGYRDLSAGEIALMNEIKAKGQELEQLVEKVGDHLADQDHASKTDPSENARIGDAQPRRWVAIAKTDLQTGLMALTRAVAQPTTF